MRNKLYKNTLIKITRSFGRYLSLMLVVFVGVTVFAGVRESVPDITASISRYVNDRQLTDFEIVSTMGLTDADAAAVRALPGVASATPGYSLDTLSGGKAVRVLGIDNSVNRYELVAGRSPKTDSECAADAEYYKIGDRIPLGSDVGDKLKNRVFTVVGTVKTPLFISANYGSASVGDGKLYSFLYVNHTVFTVGAYTRIDVKMSSATATRTFTAPYDDAASALKAELTALRAAREEARYAELYGKADTALSKQEKTLADQKAKGQKALNDAKSALDANEKKLDEAQASLQQNETILLKQETAQTAQFEGAKRQIAAGRAQVEAELKSFGVTRAQTGEKSEQLSASLRQLDEAIAQLNEQLAQLKAAESAAGASSSGAQQQLQTELQTELQNLQLQRAKLTAAINGLTKLQAASAVLDEKEAELNTGIRTYDVKITKAKISIVEGKTQLTAGRTKLSDGISAYNKNRSDFNKKITDAEKKLADARCRLADIGRPEWTILGRKDIVNGYGDIQAAMRTINTIAATLPLFFMLIVALMASNTMGRMIAEERGELGTLASLGYGRSKIIATYLLYVLSATVLGTVGGYYAGCAVIPFIVYACFPYILPPLTLGFGVPALFAILAAAVGLMGTVTAAFCLLELREKPAALLRPVPPKNGKTILLERIGPVWKRLSFTWKVTMRNIFRYKQRVLMTVMGIAGCTALMLTGFGIRDSIGGIAQKQYGGIFRYSEMMVLKSETKSIDNSLQPLLLGCHIQNPLLIRQAALSCGQSGKTADAYLIVPQNAALFPRYYALKDAGTGAVLSLNSGIVISHRLSVLTGVGRGGRLTIRDTDNAERMVTVADVAENYIQNYVYMSPEAYEKTFGKPSSYNMIVSAANVNEKTLADGLIASGKIVGVTFTDDILRQAQEQNDSLSSVVLLLIIMSSLLALIVLYNLTSINIGERTREIATLKVLGFNDSETNAYIYRETFLLTLLGIAAGLLLGVGFHSVVMSLIERDEYEYTHVILPSSFVWTFLITLLFSAVMQAVTYFKLRKIDMIESLKSVE